MSTHNQLIRETKVMRPAYALPNVSDADVADILLPVCEVADTLVRPHSIITAKEALGELWIAVRAAQNTLSDMDHRATLERMAELRNCA